MALWGHWAVLNALCNSRRASFRPSVQWVTAGRSLEEVPLEEEGMLTTPCTGTSSATCNRHVQGNLHCLWRFDSSLIAVLGWRQGLKLEVWFYMQLMGSILFPYKMTAPCFYAKLDLGSSWISPAALARSKIQATSSSRWGSAVSVSCHLVRQWLLNQLASPTPAGTRRREQQPIKTCYSIATAAPTVVLWAFRILIFV